MANIAFIASAVVLLAAFFFSSVVVVEAKSNLVVGATWDASDYTSRIRQYPDNEMCRVFWSKTSCPSWSDSRVQQLKKAGITPFLSWKVWDGDSAPCLKRLLDTMPADIPQAWLTYCHECDNPRELPPALWKSRHKTLWNIVKNHRAYKAGKIKYMAIQTRQFVENNGHKYDEWWCNCGDYFAVDMYANSWENKYPSPSAFISATKAFAKSINKPYFYPELGAIKMPSDPKDTGRAAWIRDVYALLKADPLAVGAIWWDDEGTPTDSGESRNFRLQQTGSPDPAVTAFKAVLSAHSAANLPPSVSSSAATNVDETEQDNYYEDEYETTDEEPEVDPSYEDEYQEEEEPENNYEDEYETEEPETDPSYEDEYQEEEPETTPEDQYEYDDYEDEEYQPEGQDGSIPNLDIAATIFNEARGESPAGRQAVKAVIQNREKYACPRDGRNHNLANWRTTRVFHGYSTERPNVPRAEQAIWDHCVYLASTTVPDNTRGATHFQRGPFSTDFQTTVRIGAHTFAREKTEVTRHR